MQDTDLDIVQLMIDNMPEETEYQSRIKLYMQCHKSNCNNFIYQKYSRDTAFFNSLFKSLLSDLSAEILEAMYKKLI